MGRTFVSLLFVSLLSCRKPFKFCFLLIENNVLSLKVVFSSLNEVKKVLESKIFIQVILTQTTHSGQVATHCTAVKNNPT